MKGSWMQQGKIPWRFVALGWIGGALTAFVGVNAVPYDKEFLVIGAMVLLPFILEAFSGMKHRSIPPPVAAGPSSAESAE